MFELGSLDFETYSEAGHAWDEEGQKWRVPKGGGAKKKGLGIVGASVYTEHPTAEILTASYRLPGETTKHRWRPGQPLPTRLFDSLAAGGVFKAHNRMFEFLVWMNIATPKYGWPSLLPWQFQIICTMATARVNALPGALANLSEVLKLPTPKDKDGVRLLDRYSVPRNPTKADPRLRIRPTDPGEEVDGEKLYAYCDTDLDAEEGAFQRMVPMSAEEFEFWCIDQEINYRGIGVDRPAMRDCLAVLEQALEQYGAECQAITGFGPGQLAELKGWAAAKGVHVTSMDAETVDAALERLAPHPPGGMYDVRRVFEIRQLIGSASVKKLYAMDLQVTRDDRLQNLLIHHGSRPGRPTGSGPQPLNLPKAGPELAWCLSPSCARPFAPAHQSCPWCATAGPFPKSKWGGRPKELPSHAPAAVDVVLEIMATRSLATVEWFFGPALLCISGCLRGLFVARPGYDLIASDYSQLQAVILAMLAGEDWRIDAFRSNKPLYLLSASKITGTPLETYEAYFAQHGEHHPDRQKIGKVAELANGFGGWINSSKAFGSEEPDDVIKAQILAWRAANPAIVEFWGGQYRGLPWDKTPFEYYGVEGMAIQAIQYPSVVFEFRGLKFQVRDHPAGWAALYITLLSGREMTYHKPELIAATRPHARAGEVQIIYWTENTNPKYGGQGWVPMETYGGRLTENIVMGHEVCIQRYSIRLLRAAGYPIVLPVYDENTAEIPIGTGSIEEFERLMAVMPPWAAGWPIRAAGGWRGRRYRKA